VKASAVPDWATSRNEPGPVIAGDPPIPFAAMTSTKSVKTPWTERVLQSGPYTVLLVSYRAIAWAPRVLSLAAAVNMGIVSRA